MHVCICSVYICVYIIIVTKEESIPTQSRELVSGKTDRRPPTVLPPHLTMKATNAGPNSGKGATWLERDSGCVATTPPCPRRPPPGTIPHPSEAASGFIPETSPQGNDGSSNYFAGIPVPSSTAENTNTEAQQQKSDVAEYPVFTVGSNAEISTENEPVPFQPEVSTENETDGPDTATKPVEEISKKTHLEKMDVAGAAVYLSPGIIDRLEEQKQQIEELKQQLKAQIEVKETLQEERDELQHTLQQYQQNVEAQIAISEEKIKEKEKELQKCKEQITKMKTDYREEVAKVEREKREIESQHQKVVAELEEEIANLKKEREDKKQRTEVEMLRLETRLHKAEKELAEKENLILRKEKTIAELEKKIAVESKDAEIQKLKQENRELRRGKSLSHSLSDLKIEGR